MRSGVHRSIPGTCGVRPLDRRTAFVDRPAPQKGKAEPEVRDLPLPFQPLVADLEEPPIGDHRIRILLPLVVSAPEQVPPDPVSLVIEPGLTLEEVRDARPSPPAALGTGRDEKIVRLRIGRSVEIPAHLARGAPVLSGRDEAICVGTLDGSPEKASEAALLSFGSGITAGTHQQRSDERAIRDRFTRQCIGTKA